MDVFRERSAAEVEEAEAVSAHTGLHLTASAVSAWGVPALHPSAKEVN